MTEIAYRYIPHSYHSSNSGFGCICCLVVVALIVVGVVLLVKRRR